MNSRFAVVAPRGVGHAMFLAFENQERVVRIKRDLRGCRVAGRNVQGAINQTMIYRLREKRIVLDEETTTRLENEINKLEIGRIKITRAVTKFYLSSRVIVNSWINKQRELIMESLRIN